MSLKQFLKDAKKLGKVIQNDLNPNKVLGQASDAAMAIEHSLDSIKDIVPKKVFKPISKAIEFLRGTVEYEGIKIDYGKLTYALLTIGAGLLTIVVHAMTGNMLCLPGDIASLWPAFKATYSALTKGLEIFSKYVEMVILPKLEAFKDKVDHKIIEPIKDMVKKHFHHHDKHKESHIKHHDEIKITKAEAVENCIKTHTKLALESNDVVVDDDEDDSIIISSSEEDWTGSEFDSSLEDEALTQALYATTTANTVLAEL